MLRGLNEIVKSCRDCETRQPPALTQQLTVSVCAQVVILWVSEQNGRQTAVSGQRGVLNTG